MRTIPSSELVGVETSNQVLECEAGGSPSPTIHWLKDGEPIYKVINSVTNIFDKNNKTFF